MNNNQLFNLQRFADNSLNYNKVDNPYEFYLTKHIHTKGDIKTLYDLVEYYKKIPNYNTITTLPEENANYIKEALPNVNNCEYMLESCGSLTSVDTTGWDTSNITDMFCMFNKCYKLATLDVSKWDTNKVTSMFAMFNSCNRLTTLDVSNWNTSSVTNMTSMFSNCISLTNLDVSKWDTSKVSGMYDMFNGCHELKILDISNWNTSKVTNMGYMFTSCNTLMTIKGVINMESCVDLYSIDKMFENCINLTGVKIKNPPSGITATSGIGGLAAGRYEIVS